MKKSTELPKRKRVQVTFKNPSLTKQSFKQECDINTIVNRFQNTGQIPLQNNLEPQYGNAPDLDLKTALDNVKNLHREFDDLPDYKKQIFNNNPTEYAEFLSQYEERPESFHSSFLDEPDTSVPKSTSDSLKESSDPSTDK